MLEGSFNDVPRKSFDVEMYSNGNSVVLYISLYCSNSFLNKCVCWHLILGLSAYVSELKSDFGLRLAGLLIATVLNSAYICYVIV